MPTMLPTTLTLDEGVTIAQTVTLSPAGTFITLALPAKRQMWHNCPHCQTAIPLPTARKFLQVQLMVAATTQSPVELSTANPAATLKWDSDANNNNRLDSTLDATWVELALGKEQAVQSIQVKAATVIPAPPKTGVRIRVFSKGDWLPLLPRDTFTFNQGVADIRFPALAASRILLEFLGENRVGNTYTGVMVPGGVKLAAVVVSTTPQPCLVSIALGDEAPFFTIPGVLPTEPILIEGLARALNRYLQDNPTALSVPLCIRASTPSQVKVELVDMTWLPDPLPTAVPEHQVKPKPVLKPYLAVDEPWQTRGQRCGGGYSAAQAFQALPALQRLVAVHIYARTLNTMAVTAQLSIHADGYGKPVAQALTEAVIWQSTPTANKAGWIRVELPKALALTQATWWLMLQVTEGELLWYHSEMIPNVAGVALYQTSTNPWLPLPTNSGQTAWLQTQLELKAC